MADSAGPGNGNEKVGGAAGSRRRWSRVDRALAGVVAIWALSLVALVVVRDEPTPPEPSRATPTEAVTAPVPERDGLPPSTEIVEALEISTGFTPGEAAFCTPPDSAGRFSYPGADTCPAGYDREVVGDGVSYGIVIENTSDFVVNSISISYRFLDSDGEAVPTSSRAARPGRTSHTAQINQLEPGEVTGLGGSPILEHDEVATVEVDISEDSLYAVPIGYFENFALTRAEQVPGFDPFDVSATGIELDRSEPASEPVVHYTIESHQDVTTTVRDATAIFRDTDGEIVGGYDATADISPGVPVPADGTVRREMTIHDPMGISGIDPDRTAIYLFPRIL